MLKVMFAAVNRPAQKKAAEFLDAVAVVSTDGGKVYSLYRGQMVLTHMAYNRDNMNEFKFEVDDPSRERVMDRGIQLGLVMLALSRGIESDASNLRPLMPDAFVFLPPRDFESFDALTNYVRIHSRQAWCDKGRHAPTTTLFGADKVACDSYGRPMGKLADGRMVTEEQRQSAEISTSKTCGEHGGPVGWREP